MAQGGRMMASTRQEVTWVPPYIRWEQAAPGAVKALPLLTVLEDVLEEASAQQVSSALC